MKALIWGNNLFLPLFRIPSKEDKTKQKYICASTSGHVFPSEIYTHEEIMIKTKHEAVEIDLDKAIRIANAVERSSS